MLFNTYESVILTSGSHGLPENFSEANIKHLFELKSEAVNKSLKTTTTKTGTENPEYSSVTCSLLNLMGGFEGVGNLLSEVAIMKTNIKMMQAQIEELQVKVLPYMMDP